MERQIDKLQISAEGVVALPHSLVRCLDLLSGDDIFARVDGAKIVLHRMNPRRIARTEPRPVGFGSQDFQLPEGWEKRMTDDEVDDLLNGPLMRSAFTRLREARARCLPPGHVDAPLVNHGAAPAFGSR